MAKKFKDSGVCRVKVNKDQLDLASTGLGLGISVQCVFPNELNGKFTQALNAELVGVISPTQLGHSVENASVMQIGLETTFIGGDNMQYFAEASRNLYQNVVENSYKLHLKLKYRSGVDFYIAVVYHPEFGLGGYKQCGAQTPWLN